MSAEAFPLAGARPRDVNPWIVAIAVMSATFMEILDTTVVNVSLPHIAGNLSATIDESTWALTSYLVANAIVLPLTGWLANHFGRKRLLLTSVAGFTTASFLCGLAPNLPLLILFRVIQGFTGGALQPISQAVLLEAFKPEDRGRAMGFWGLGIVVAPILGPVVGGWLTDSYSWRWVFYINLPVGLLSLALIQLYVHDPPYIARRSDRIDYWGIGLLALGIGALQLLLDMGQQDDWFESRFITTLLVLAIGGLVAFVLRELHAEHPVVDLRVLKVRTYATGVFLMTVLGFVLYGSLVLLPLMLQTLLGYPSLQAGIALAPRGMGSFIAMPLVGVAMSRVDARKLLAGGIVMGAFTLFWLGSLNRNLGYWDIFWPQFLQGLGLGLLFVPLTTITMGPIPRENMGNATSIFNLMRNLGGSMGIAAATTLLARHRQEHTSTLVSHVDAYTPQARAMLEQLRSAFVAQGSDLVTAAQRARLALFGMVEREAMMLSFTDIFRWLALLFLAMLPLLLLMQSPRRGRPGPGAAH
jgi:MFS transporter, DHA2 family, multidrug resistance protein